MMCESSIITIPQNSTELVMGLQETSMLVVTVQFQAKTECVAEFREAILFQARSSRENEIGCRQFDVCQSVEDPTLFTVYEIYDDAAAFEIHKTSPHSQITQGKVPDLLVSRDLRIWNRIDG